MKKLPMGWVDRSERTGMSLCPGGTLNGRISNGWSIFGRKTGFSVYGRIPLLAKSQLATPNYNQMGGVPSGPSLRSTSTHSSFNYFTILCIFRPNSANQGTWPFRHSATSVIRPIGVLPMFFRPIVIRPLPLLPYVHMFWLSHVPMSLCSYVPMALNLMCQNKQNSI